MDIKDFPENTQEQLRNLMEWTETMALDKVVAEAIESHWQTVKSDTFGEHRAIVIKASGPGKSSADIRCSQGASRAGGGCGLATEAQEQAWQQAIKYVNRGLVTEAKVALEATFDLVTIEGPGH